MATDSYSNAPPAVPPGGANVRVWSAGTVPAERPSPQAVLGLLALFLVPVAFIPASRGTLVEAPPLPRAWWTNYLVILFGVLALLFRLLGHSRAMRRSTLLWFVTPIVLLGCWQVLSVTWNGQSSFLTAYSLMQSLCMVAAVVGAAMTCSGLTLESRVRVLAGLTLLIAAVLFVYAGLSFVFPSLRPSHDMIDRTAAGLGFIRIFGPLGKSTVLNFVILPALGFSIGMVFLRTAGQPYWLTLSVFFVGCIVATGSRGGLLCLASYGALMLLLGGLRALLVLIPFGLALLLIVAVVGIPERFKTFEDNARLATYETALVAYAASPQHALVGTGHGALYTKLHDDSERKRLGKSRWFLLFHTSEYGPTLRNSHSALLRSLVETGPLGLLLTLMPLVWLGLRSLSTRFRSVSRPGRMFLRSSLAGCLAIVPYLLFEEFFITAFWIVVIWTVFVVCVSEGVDDTVVTG